MELRAFKKIVETTKPSSCKTILVYGKFRASYECYNYLSWIISY